VSETPTPPQLQEWVVSSRVNKTGTGDDDPTTVEPFKETLLIWNLTAPQQKERSSGTEPGFYPLICWAAR
jgi:hypothetical protein